MTRRNGPTRLTDTVFAYIPEGPGRMDPLNTTHLPAGEAPAQLIRRSHS